MTFNILIVDDEQHITETLAFLLREQMDADCNVVCASSGYEAIRLLEHFMPDLLITDMRMPGISGIELIGEVVKKYPDCQSVVLTGYNDFESAYSAIQMNVAGYLLKSENDETILRTLEGVLSRIEQKFPRETDALDDANDAPYNYTASFIKKYISEHISEDISLPTLADMAGYNGDYLCKVFKKATGETIGKYTAEQRINRVRELMADSSLSIEDIGSMCGFSSRSYFNRFVKLYTGKNPRKLRMEILQNEDKSKQA